MGPRLAEAARAAVSAYFVASVELSLEGARPRSRVADVALDEIELRTEGADRGEDRRGGARGREHPDRQRGSGTICGERRSRIARRRYDETDRSLREHGE